MYRAASLIVAGVAVVAALTVYAEPPADPGDDPPMLKKKGAPDIDDSGLKAPADDKDKDKDKKPDAPKPDGDKPAEQAKPRIDPDEVLKDVAKSMKSAEERLAKQELGDPTRQAQEDALKGLDSLIDLAENPPDDPDSKDKQSNKDNKRTIREARTTRPPASRTLPAPPATRRVRRPRAEPASAAGAARRIRARAA